MPKRQRLGWYSFYKKSLDTIRAVVPNPPPINAKLPVRLPCGALYFDVSNPESTHGKAPIIRSRLGNFKSEPEIAEMRKLRQENPQRWSIGTLSSKFSVTRSFIISAVLSAQERNALEKETEDRFLSLPMAKVKGRIVSARIRQIRESAL